MSKLTLYNAIAEKVETLKPAFHWGGLFNNQFEKEGFEDARRWPVVFIEFASLNWSNTVGTATKMQQSDVEFALYIGFKTITKSDDSKDYLATVDELYKALNGLENYSFDPVRRLNETQPLDWDNVFVWKTTFRTTLRDDTAANLGSQVTFATDMTIEKNLVVENAVVRSGTLPEDNPIE